MGSHVYCRYRCDDPVSAVREYMQDAEDGKLFAEHRGNYLLADSRRNNMAVPVLLRIREIEFSCSSGIYSRGIVVEEILLCYNR